MYEDFKECVIRLMQHPIMSKPVSFLSDSECLQAYDLIKQLIDLSVNEEYTQLDYIQMARLKYHLGELAYQLNTDNDTTLLHYKSLPHLLEKGGFDLSLRKWAELVSLRIKE